MAIIDQSVLGSLQRNPSRVISIFLTKIALSAMWCLPVFAADSVLQIGVAEFPPFKYTSPEGKIIGSDTEIVEQVIQRMGYTPNIQMQPWKRVQFMAEKGEFAAIYSFTKTPDREKIYYFSDPINTVKDVFFKQKSKKISWRGLDDLKDFRVGASDGYSYAPIFKYAIDKKLFASYEATASSTPEILNLDLVRRDNFDVFICEVSVCQYLIKANAPKFDALDYIDKPIGDVRTFHVGFPKIRPGAEDLMKRFNLELAKFVKEGGRQKIFKKYGIVSHLR